MFEAFVSFIVITPTHPRLRRANKGRTHAKEAIKDSVSASLEHAIALEEIISAENDIDINYGVA